MRAALLTAVMYFPCAFSLKDRRQMLQRIKATLSKRFGASVAQVGDKDKWQTAELSIAIACESEGAAREKAAAVKRLLENGDEYELASLDAEYV